MHSWEDAHTPNSTVRSALYVWRCSIPVVLVIITLLPPWLPVALSLQFAGMGWLAGSCATAVAGSLVCTPRAHVPTWARGAARPVLHADQVNQAQLFQHCAVTNILVE